MKRAEVNTNINKTICEEPYQCLISFTELFERTISKVLEQNLPQTLDDDSPEKTIFDDHEFLCKEKKRQYNCIRNSVQQRNDSLVEVVLEMIDYVEDMYSSACSGQNSVV